MSEEHLHPNEEVGSPVAPEAERPPSGKLDDGIGLCLSGGGYRAMLFHLGSLWRLDEAGYLPKLARISSVSGGSITAAVLGLKWKNLSFDPVTGSSRAFVSEVVVPIRNLAAKTIDEGAIIGGILLPGSIPEKVANAYRKYLFKDATLQDLPDDPPRFVINATNVQSGALWRFMKPYMRDYKVGEVPKPKIELAVAVGASSAFPPVLSPVRLELDASSYSPGNEPLHREPYITDVVLTDGGVYDNLGLETVWKRYRTVLVSDGGGQMQSQAEPKSDWVRHALRVNELIDNQVRSLRKRQLMRSFSADIRKGAYWGIRTNVADYHPGTALPCPYDKTMALANVETRLKRLDNTTQEHLINWGYAVCDAALRSYLDPKLPQPAGFPYASGVG